MGTYSFTDCSLILNHPSLGILTLTGKGLGSVGINMTGDRTTMEPAADGRVLIRRRPENSLCLTRWPSKSFPTAAIRRRVRCRPGT